jgi:hypothetical protein
MQRQVALESSVSAVEILWQQRSDPRKKRYQYLSNDKLHPNPTSKQKILYLSSP